jgi:hypothetical protein
MTPLNHNNVLDIPIRFQINNQVGGIIIFPLNIINYQLILLWHMKSTIHYFLKSFTNILKKRRIS